MTPILAAFKVLSILAAARAEQSITEAEKQSLKKQRKLEDNGTSL